MDRSRVRHIVQSGRAPARERHDAPEDSDGWAQSDVQPALAVLGAQRCATPYGSCFVVERRMGLERHGHQRLDECAAALRDGGAALSLLDPRAGPAGEGPMLFLDLETTGLCGGAGTVAFLAGAAFFDGDGRFVVRQYLLHEFGAERALLHALAELAGGAGTIVTFNGRRFDLPVLETRWLFHRLPFPFEAVPHVDMLPPARRLWRTRRWCPADREPPGRRRRSDKSQVSPRWQFADERGSLRVAPDASGPGETNGGCSLVALERRLLGVRRVGDVPGFEIPSRYFRFLRAGDVGGLAPVLEHNRLDLVSLAAVTARACALVAGGPRAARDAVEALAVGRLYERAGREVEAVEAFRLAAGLAASDRHGSGVRVEALRRLARQSRRARRWDEAAGLWRELLEAGDLSAAVRHEALTALAVHQEHRVRDLRRARVLARQAVSAADPVRQHDARRRLARIERKLAPSGPEPLPGPTGPTH